MSLEAVPDYHSFVAPESEMSLHIIEREARAGRYNSRAEFRADMAKIAAAAAAYNTAGTCRFEREHALQGLADVFMIAAVLALRAHSTKVDTATQPASTRPPAVGTATAYLGILMVQGS